MLKLFLGLGGLQMLDEAEGELRGQEPHKLVHIVGQQGPAPKPEPRGVSVE